MDILKFFLTLIIGPVGIILAIFLIALIGIFFKNGNQPQTIS